MSMSLTVFNSESNQSLSSVLHATNALLSLHARVANTYESTLLPLPYGTAGFRCNAIYMPHVAVRCAILAVLRSKVSGGKYIGLCVTASHNPAQDNGIKLINYNGEMLCKEFESYASMLINASDPFDCFTTLAKNLNIDLQDNDVFTNCNIILGRDTRNSSPALIDIVKLGIESLGAKYIDLGIVTTPQVHFSVQKANTLNQQIPVLSIISNYYNSVVSTCNLFLLKAQLSTADVANAISDYNNKFDFPRFLPDRLVCDGANGVGAQQVQYFASLLLSMINISLEIRNNGIWPGDELNYLSGAEYVQKEKCAPIRFGPTVYDPAYLRCFAFDGDADRLVYFTFTNHGKFVLLDGDKIASLYMLAITRMLKALLNNNFVKSNKKLNIAVIQTSYANGSSTAFLTNIINNFPKQYTESITFSVACTKTGVKHLHNKGREYDIAIYFESNGHGTVLTNFSSLLEWAKNCNFLKAIEFEVLFHFLQLFNQGTGDAIVDMLAVELCLKYLELSFTEWIRLYDEYPSIQKKIEMPRVGLDALQVSPADESQLLAPKEIVEKLSLISKKHPSPSRTFIRPSGTEDVCRIYAEAKTTAEVEELVKDVEAIVLNYKKTLY